MLETVWKLTAKESVLPSSEVLATRTSTPQEADAEKFKHAGCLLQSTLGIKICGREGKGAELPFRSLIASVNPSGNYERLDSPSELSPNELRWVALYIPSLHTGKWHDLGQEALCCQGNPQRGWPWEAVCRQCSQKLQQQGLPQRGTGQPITVYPTHHGYSLNLC